MDYRITSLLIYENDFVKVIIAKAAMDAPVVGAGVLHNANG